MLSPPLDVPLDLHDEDGRVDAQVDVVRRAVGLESVVVVHESVHRAMVEQVRVSVLREREREGSSQLKKKWREREKGAVS